MAHAAPTLEEYAAAITALTRKPRGRRARAFFSYIRKLNDEYDDLTRVEGPKARKRQIAIAKEIGLYNFPVAGSDLEYHTAMDAGLNKYDGQYGRHFREEDTVEDSQLASSNMRSDFLKEISEDDIPF